MLRNENNHNLISIVNIDITGLDQFHRKIEFDFVASCFLSAGINVTQIPISYTGHK